MRGRKARHRSRNAKRRIKTKDRSERRRRQQRPTVGKGLATGTAWELVQVRISDGAEGVRGAEKEWVEDRPMPKGRGLKRGNRNRRHTSRVTDTTLEPGSPSSRGKLDQRLRRFDMLRVPLKGTGTRPHIVSGGNDEEGVGGKERKRSNRKRGR